MTFEPNQYEKKPVPKGWASCLRAFGKSFYPHLFGRLLAIGLWVGSGVFSGDANTVEPAQAIKTRSADETPFRVIAREISAATPPPLCGCKAVPKLTGL